MTTHADAGRFDRAAAHPRFGQASAHTPPMPAAGSASGALTASLALGAVGLGAALAAAGERFAWSTFLGVSAVGVVGAGLSIWSKLRSGGTKASFRRELVVVIETRPTSSSMRLMVQTRTGQRLDCYGHQPVARQMVAVGDMGVAFLAPGPLGDTMMLDFVRIDV